MPLFEAIENHDLEFVRQYLLQGGDPNVPDENGSSPLHEAVYQGDEEITRLLIAHGADIHQTDDYGNTALHVAALQGFQDQASLLVSQGAVVDAANESRTWTPLMLALNEGHTELAKWLLDAGADVNHVDPEEGWTPLLVACDQGLRDLSLLLIAKGAHTHACLTGGDGQGKYAIHLASYYGEAPIVRALVMSGVDINLLPANGGLAAIHWATYNPHLDLLEFLVQNGADVNIQASGIYQMRTPLHFAVASRREDLAHCLLTHGADPLLKDADRRTPFDLAKDGYKQSRDEVFTRLIRKMEEFV